MQLLGKFQIFLTDHAVTDLKSITKDLREKIHQDLRRLESTPFPSGNFIKKLKGFRPPVYRMRSGDFRILYHIENEVVTVLRLIDRKDLERVIKKLKI